MGGKVDFSELDIIIPLMPVIKGLFLAQCYHSGRTQLDISRETAMNVIKSNSFFRNGYIGEKGVLDVDVSKVECEACRRDLQIEFGLPRERR